MKRFLLLVLLFIPIRAWGACSGLSPNLTAPTWTDVAACYTAAVDGDTITVTAGNYTVTSQTTIGGKFVKIVPGGVVNLTDNVCAGACFNGTTDNLILITGSTAGSTQFGSLAAGFHITQGSSVHDNPSGMVHVIDDTALQPVLVLGNTFTMTAASGDMMIGYGLKGIVSGNTFNGYVADIGGICANNSAVMRVNHDGSAWTQISKFGNLDTTGTYTWFFEGNTVSNVLEGIDLLAGTRIVIRFNTVANSAVPVFHGADTGTYSGRYAEVYNNTYVRDTTFQTTCGHGGTWWTAMNSFIALRGGTVLALNNVIPDINDGLWGVKNPVLFANENIWRKNNGGVWRCWGTAMNPDMFTGYPDVYQIGWGYITGGTQAGNATISAVPVMMDRQPTYLANNTGTGNYGNPGLETFAGGNECGSTQSIADYVVSDREYYKQVALGSFTGTSGASQGLRSERPASTTNGVAFWSTDQGGDWNTTGGSANDGCLDVVVSGAWVNCWYTPFIYPHPDVSPTPYLAFSVQPTSLQSATTFSPVVKVTVHQSNGNTDTGATGTVTLTINACGSSLTGTASGSPASGIVTFTGLGAVGAASGCALTAAISGGTTATAATSNSFNVTASPTDFLTFSQQPGNITAGDAFSPTLTVTVNLPGGGTDTGATGTVTLKMNGCGAVLSGTVSASVSSGIATFTGLGATGAGTACNLTASISGGTVATGVTSSNFNVTPYFLSFSQGPENIVSGVNFFPTLSVTVNQPGGGTYLGAKGTITLTINVCASALTGTPSAMPVLGVATFTGLGAAGAGTGCTITATITGGTVATAVTSNSFDVTTTTGPTLTTLSPTSGQVGKVYNMVLLGTRFNAGNATINLIGPSNVTVSNTVVVSATRITAKFSIPGKATLGANNVTVTTDEGMTGAKVFTVTRQNNPKPPAQRRKVPVN